MTKRTPGGDTSVEVPATQEQIGTIKPFDETTWPYKKAQSPPRKHRWLRRTLLIFDI